MGLIKFDERTLLNVKNVFDTSNDEILTSLEKIYNEYANMSETLNTPKSQKKLPECVDYLNKKVNFVRKSKDNYNLMFDNISKDYHDFSNEVNISVGGNNGNK